MKDYLNTVNDRFPVRRSDEEKTAFRDFVFEETEKNGYKAEVEVLEKKHHNILIGDVSGAEVIFTAHYDTPACSLFPNLMMPRNKTVGMLYAFGIPILMALLSLGVAFGISSAFSLDSVYTALLYLVIYFALFFGLMRRGPNKHNKNDNTSGVAAVLSLTELCCSEKTAFVLFDHEEQGTLGSKAFYKTHKKELANKLIVNLDCVGNGENIIVVAKEAAKAHKLYRLLTDNFRDEETYHVSFFPKKGSMSNTDYKNFPCALSVMACHRHPVFGYYTPRIHTGKDTVADKENIRFIALRLSAFANAV